MSRKVFKPNLIITLSLTFLLLLLTIGMYLWSIHGSIQIYSKHVNDINKLRLLNKDFNTFSLQKGSFVNYDIINRQIKDFDITINNLQKSMIQNTEDSKLLQALIEIKSDYHKKTSLLEHFKSFNSAISSSLQYLYDLKKSINKLSSVEKSDKQMMGSTLTMTTKLYVGLIKSTDKIKQNIQKIKTLAEQSKNDYIWYFHHNEKSIVEKILSIQKEQKSVNSLDISSKLDLVYMHLENKYQVYLITSNIILILFMFSMVTMISFILYLYRKSLRDKIELQAYKYAIENSDNSIVITDPDHNITYVNEAFERETGYKKEEVLGENPRILKSGLMPQEHYSTLIERLKNLQKWEGEFINRKKDGTLMYEKASINPIIINNTLTHYIAIKLNITEYVEQEKKVEFIALHDQLTSLPNRLHFERNFNEEIFKKNKQATLLYIDLDRFKTINDSLGHHVGDELLKVFAKRLQYALDKNDFIARIGGDEFVVILDIQNAEDANNVAQRILQLLQTPINVLEHNLNITTSIGISFFPSDGNTLETLLKNADTAMYRAKNRGRNNFEFFTQELSDEINERLEVEQALRNALKNNEFYLVYQPKYSLKTNKVIGFEALIRWEHHKLGFVGPDKFIPIAEDIGIIHKIGLFVFEKACSDFKAIREIDPTLQSIAINISTIQFKEEDFIETLNNICSSIGLDPTGIELEITESCIMDDIEKNIQMLHKLREHGYKIAIDDFGTGYSSFGYLKKLPINTIKIDKSFVDDITSQKSDKDIVNAIINLSHNLGFQTVAEGIEYEAQEKLLLEDGCDLGQGYNFCRPQKIEEMKEFIKSQKTEQVLLTA
jgi:diguanylate cyclase (GGDEF)-like protein/PAS domain S-box-containing protein